MAKILEMPKLSPTMEEGVLAAWHKKEGDEIGVDDLLAEVETDKATMEFRAFDKGTLLKILVQPGAKVLLGQPVAVVGEAGEDVSALVAKSGGAAPAAAATPPTPNAPPASNAAPTPNTSVTRFSTTWPRADWTKRSAARLRPTIAELWACCPECYMWRPSCPRPWHPRQLRNIRSPKDRPGRIRHR